MKRAKNLLSLLSFSLFFYVLNIGLNTPSAQAISLVNNLTIPGESVDLTPVSGGQNSANVNRLGFFSDLYYNRHENVYYGLSDRGPGGGVIPYQTRVQKFSLDTDSNTGAISNFKILETIKFTNNGSNFNGLNPRLLNGDASVLGLSFDPEGFVVAPNGNFYVSDEYGPSVYEFTSSGSLVRSFQTPENILPKVGTQTNYVDGRGTITTGRQDNRGFEGLTVSPDGSKLYAMLQDPLVNEGSSNDGRRSRNLRIVEFDASTGASTAQYIYQLEALADINDRIPGTEDDFSATAQGRNIGISSITAINDREFFIIERDNRGLGVDDPTIENPVASKRVYRISLDGATDVSNISLANLNLLPAGVTPVSKSANSFIDIAALLKDSGQIIPEKFEGFTIGPQLADGDFALLVGTDNDYSVTQGNAGEQQDVCTDGVTSSQVSIDSGCPAGKKLIPGYLYSFKGKVAGYVQPQKASAKTPEPSSIVGLVLMGLISLPLKRFVSNKK